MKVLVLYRPTSEHARSIEEFVHDFQERDPSYKVEMESLDTRNGAATASMYDVVQYPAILVVADDGRLIRSWEGETLPLMNEVAAYSSL